MSSKRVAAGLLAASLVGSLLAHTSAVLAVAPSRDGLTVSVRTIAPGLVSRTIVDPSGPWVIHQLVVDPSRRPLDTVAAGRMGTWARTSTMGSDADALAAVNGDFSVWPGGAMHPFGEDGSLKESGVQRGAMLGVRADGSVAAIRRGEVHVAATNIAAGSAIDVASWNTGAPAGGAIAGFTPFGGSVERPPRSGCSVRLAASGRQRWSHDGESLVRGYTVEVRRCRAERMPVLAGTVVLSSKTTGPGAAWLKGLRKGSRVRLAWGSGMPGVSDVIGGIPLLVRDGEVVTDAQCSTWLCHRNPRTAAGYTEDGRAVLVVVDGRSLRSVGMTIAELAREMLALGATNALNLDGGGSATMWIKGRGVVNVPSDSSGERPVTNALVVLP